MQSPPDFGVYVHWPYCARICPYCDFNVFAAKTIAPEPLLAAIMGDLSATRARTGRRPVASVFLGGGTPSLLSQHQVAGLLETIDRLWGLKAGAEISLEANPDDAARFAGFAAAGVNRLSIGVQSLDDARLKFLGRTHSAAAAREAIAHARGLFPSLSIDLIYALPEETPEGWRSELEAALEQPADHLSLYELSIEPGAAFSRAVGRGAWAPLDDDAAADLYDLTQDICERAGFPAYEVSNHARSPAHQSVHNTLYWTAADWAGVGPGGHGRLTLDGARIATEAESRPDRYIARVGAEGTGWSSVETLDAVDRTREALAMGLRLVEGQKLSTLEASGAPINRAALNELVESGHVALEADRDGGQRIRLTRAGLLAADRIALELAP